jgi:uncharacterized membrane protein YadS
MNVNSALSAGKMGFFFTVASILSTLLLGILLGKWLKIDSKTSHLISCGTAICGGCHCFTVIQSDDENRLQFL